MRPLLPILALFALTGCQNLAKQAASDHTAIQTSTNATRQQAQSIGDNQKTIVAKADHIDATAQAAMDEIKSLPSVPQVLMQALQSNQADAREIKAAASESAKSAETVNQQADNIDRLAAHLEETVNKAVDEKLERELRPYRVMGVIGALVIALSLVVLWWTEKPRYALAVFSVGAALCVVAYLAGWALSHPGQLALVIVGSGVLVAVVEWVRHPATVSQVLGELKAQPASPAK